MDKARLDKVENCNGDRVAQGKTVAQGKMFDALGSSPRLDKLRAIAGTVDGSSRQKVQAQRFESVANRNQPVQRVILDDSDEPVDDAVLLDQISGYSDGIQEIILQIHADDQAGFTLEQALEIAREEVGEDIPKEPHWFDKLMEGTHSSSEDDSDYSNSDSGKPLKKVRAKKRKPPKQDFATTSTFKGSTQRPAKEPVKITREEVGHPGGKFRTSSVSGLVRPTTTKGRPGAPEPDVGPKVGVKWKDVGTVSSRDTGIVDAQKGHLMALELGGPDIPESIVAQWGQFQANGTWRKAEVAVLKLAEEQELLGNRVHFDCQVHYKKYQKVSLGTLQGVFMPIGFTMTVTIQDSKGDQIGEPKVMFDGQQAQDHTDDKMAYRAMDKADEEEDGSDSGSSSSSD